MKDKILEFKQRGFSVPQLFKIGKAISLNLPLERLDDINLTPAEMDSIIKEEQKKENRN